MMIREHWCGWQVKWGESLVLLCHGASDESDVFYWQSFDLGMFWENGFDLDNGFVEVAEGLGTETGTGWGERQGLVEEDQIVGDAVVVGSSGHQSKWSSKWWCGGGAERPWVFRGFTETCRGLFKGGVLGAKAQRIWSGGTIKLLGLEYWMIGVLKDLGLFYFMGPFCYCLVHKKN